MFVTAQRLARGIERLRLFLLLPVDTETGDHEIALEALHDFCFDAAQRCTLPSHLEDNRGLHRRCIGCEEGEHHITSTAKSTTRRSAHTTAKET